MNRREFVSRFSGAAAAGSAATATVLATTRQAAGDGAERMAREWKALNKRIDDLDESHKRMFRALVVVATLSTGIDALTLLKGDLLS